MSTRSLSFLVLCFVLGTVLTVGWYLEGERDAESRAAPGESGPRLQHVWRSYPGAVSTRRGRAPRSPVTGSRSSDTPAAERAPTWQPVPLRLELQAVDDATTFGSPVRN